MLRFPVFAPGWTQYGRIKLDKKLYINGQTGYKTPLFHMLGLVRKFCLVLMVSDILKTGGQFQGVYHLMLMFLQLGVIMMRDAMRAFSKTFMSAASVSASMQVTTVENY